MDADSGVFDRPVLVTHTCRWCGFDGEWEAMFRPPCFVFGRCPECGDDAEWEM